MIETFVEFLKTLQDPLAWTIVAFVLYNLAQLGNIVLGIGISSDESDEKFDKTKFISGLKKGLFVGIACIITVIVAGGLGWLVEQGFDIPFDASQIGYTALVVTFGVAGVAKLLEIVKKIGVYTGVSNSIANAVTSDNTVVATEQEIAETKEEA